jgi:hypothetical protein
MRSLQLASQPESSPQGNPPTTFQLSIAFSAASFFRTWPFASQPFPVSHQLQNHPRYPAVRWSPKSPTTSPPQCANHLLPQSEARRAPITLTHR